MDKFGSPEMLLSQRLRLSSGDFAFLPIAAADVLRSPEAMADSIHLFA